MIKIYEPFLNKSILKYAHETLDSTWIGSQGKYLEIASEELKERLGCKYVILTSNGTTATHLIAKNLKKFKPKIKKIIAPNNVFVAAWNALAYEYAFDNFIFYDSDLETWNMDYSKLETIEEDSLFLIVHNIGNIINVPKLKNRFPKSVFIEDNCEGLFGKYEGKLSGTESFASSISFFSNKTITSGEGGAFITNEEEVYNYTKSIYSQAQTSTRYLHEDMGYNYRMTNVQAALLYGQLKHLDEILDKKRNLFDFYNKNLSNYCIMQKQEENTEKSNWMFGIRILGNENFDSINNFMINKEIEIRQMFFPVTSHEYLKNVKCSSIKNSSILNKECVILPSHPNVTQEQAEYVCESIKEYIAKNKLI